MKRLFIKCLNMNFSCFLKAAQRLALAAVGGRADSPSKRDKPNARKKPKNAVRTHRQLHAVLGRLALMILYGFNS